MPADAQSQEKYSPRATTESLLRYRVETVSKSVNLLKQIANKVAISQHLQLKLHMRPAEPAGMANQSREFRQ